MEYCCFFNILLFCDLPKFPKFFLHGKIPRGYTYLYIGENGRFGLQGRLFCLQQQLFQRQQGGRLDAEIMYAQ